jgi:hypothetical protein
MEIFKSWNLEVLGPELPARNQSLRGTPHTFVQSFHQLLNLLLISEPLDAVIDILIARHLALKSRRQSKQDRRVGRRLRYVSAN